jgi:hypothetical protein
MIRLSQFHRRFSVLSHLRSIEKTGINTQNIVFNPTVAKLYEIAFLLEPPSDPYTRQSYVS